MKQQLEEQLEKDIALMNSLKVSSISHVLCETNKGELKLKLEKGNKHYELLLDQIPLTAEELTFVLPNLEHLI